MTCKKNVLSQYGSTFDRQLKDAGIKIAFVPCSDYSVVAMYCRHDAGTCSAGASSNSG